MFKRFVLCLTLLCFTCIVSTANALEIGVPLSLDSENPSAAGIYYMNILEASGAYEYLQDGYKDTWFTVRQGHTNGATRSQARINGIYVFGSGRYHIQANNYVPPHEFIEGSTYYHDFDGYYLAKGYELVQVEPTQSHMSLGNNPTGSDIHWDVAPGYGIERFTVGPAASGGGNNAEIDEETLKKLVETTLKDLGYELGGNGGSGGNGGGSVSLSKYNLYHDDIITLYNLVGKIITTGTSIPSKPPPISPNFAKTLRRTASMSEEDNEFPPP